MERVERLTNVIATLLATPRLLTLDEIVTSVAGYPENRDNARRQFERDKETLRELDIPVVTELTDPLGTEYGYRIKPGEYYLPNLDLTESEQAALHMAITAVRIEGSEDAPLWKLGGLTGEAAHPMAELPNAALLPTLLTAYQQRAAVTFIYRDSERTLEPYGILLRRGRWYAVGRLVEANEQRAFRVDRVESELVVGSPNSYEIPDAIDLNELLHDDPLTLGDAPLHIATIRVDSMAAGWAESQAGKEQVAQKNDDGSLTLQIPVANWDALRSWLIDLGEHAEILDPPELREAFVAWLQELVTAS